MAEGVARRDGSLPSIGERVAGTFELVRTIGEGGMAVVYEAVNLRDGSRVALKVLAPEYSRDAELIARFDREARAVARLTSPFVTRVSDIGVSERGLPFIVMELLTGRDLDVELRSRERLPLPEAVDYVLQAAAGMHEAHAVGIIHRDLKPANLFLADVDGDRRVKVLDFGISKVLGDVKKLTTKDAVMGTVIYMPPEQIRAATSVDARADIWSLGIILYELLCGRAPFEGVPMFVASEILSSEPPDIRTFAPEIPEGLARVIARMLARNVADRYSTVRDAASALLPWAPVGSTGKEAIEALAANRPSAIPPIARGSSPSAAPFDPKRTVPLVRGGAYPFAPPSPRAGASPAPSGHAPVAHAGPGSDRYVLPQTGPSFAPGVNPHTPASRPSHPQPLAAPGTLPPQSARSAARTIQIAIAVGIIVGLLASVIAVVLIRARQRVIDTAPAPPSVATTPSSPH